MQIVVEAAGKNFLMKLKCSYLVLCHEYHENGYLNVLIELKKLRKTIVKRCIHVCPYSRSHLQVHAIQVVSKCMYLAQKQCLT